MRRLVKDSFRSIAHASFGEKRSKAHTVTIVESSFQADA
jgi:hypothetical protein